MVRQVRTGFMIGVLTLAALGAASAQLGPASAQGLIRPGGAVVAYTGVVTPFGYQPGLWSSNLILPELVLHYQIPPQPEVVYVPVPVTSPRPPVEQIETMVVSLRSSTPLQDLHVQKRGTVLTWTGGDERPRTIIVEPDTGLPYWMGAHIGRQSGVLRADSALSLAFNQPGIYRYYLQEKPDEHARIFVEQ